LLIVGKHAKWPWCWLAEPGRLSPRVKKRDFMGTRVTALAIPATTKSKLLDRAVIAWREHRAIKLIR
jgi:hypothetical protein